MTRTLSVAPQFPYSEPGLRRFMCPPHNLLAAAHPFGVAAEFSTFAGGMFSSTDQAPR